MCLFIGFSTFSNLAKNSLHYAHQSQNENTFRKKIILPKLTRSVLNTNFKLKTNILIICIIVKFCMFRCTIMNPIRVAKTKRFIIKTISACDVLNVRPCD